MRQRDRRELAVLLLREAEQLALDRADLGEREARRQRGPALAELRVEVVLQRERRDELQHRAHHGAERRVADHHVPVLAAHHRGVVLLPARALLRVVRAVEAHSRIAHSGAGFPLLLHAHLRLRAVGTNTRIYDDAEATWVQTC